MFSMKFSRLVACSLIVVAPLTASCGSASTGNTSEPIGKVSLMPATQVIDVRTPQEFAAGHISGATNLDLEGGALAASLASLDKAASYSVYCHSGRRSEMAKKLMTDAGFTNVTDLGGIEVAAKTLALPIVTK